jgi:hypothetical protein
MGKEKGHYYYPPALTINNRLDLLQNISSRRVIEEFGNYTFYLEAMEQKQTWDRVNEEAAAWKRQIERSLAVLRVPGLSQINLELSDLVKLLFLQNEDRLLSPDGRRAGSHVRTHMGDAVAMTRIAQTVCREKNINSGNSLVDLGSGTGIPLAAFAGEGMDLVTGIELDPELIVRAEHNLSQLKAWSYPNLERVRLLEGSYAREVGMHPDIDQALADADIWYSYPWREEVGRNLRLFKEKAKGKAVMLMYNAGEYPNFTEKDIEREELKLITIPSQDIPAYELVDYQAWCALIGR